MTEVVEVLVRALVDQPDEVEVTERSRRNGTIYIDVAVGPGDTGKIIGKRGRIAAAIRSVVNAAAAKEDMRAVINIVT
jgi:uncharacterized protein